MRFIKALTLSVGLLLSLSAYSQSTAVIAAYQGEFDNLLTALESFEQEEIEVINGVKFYIGQAHGHDLVLFQSGIGLVNAAMTLQMALDHFDIERILFSGVAGGTDPSLLKGDLTIASQWHYYEYGARFTLDESTGEYRVPEFMQSRISDIHLQGFYPYPKRVIRDGLDQPQIMPFFETDRELMQYAVELAKEIDLINAHGDEAKILTETVGGSGFAFNDSAAIRDFIQDNWNTAAVDMESAAFAHVAWVNQVPILQVRAISDLVGNESPNEFYEFKAVAELNAAKFVDQLLQKIPTEDSAMSQQAHLEHPYIYHLIQADLWNKAVNEGSTYYPPTYEQDGFTHATANPAQLLNVANHFYTEVPGQWLCLEMTVESLAAAGIEVIFEGTAPVGDKEPDFPGTDDELFPHILGGITADAVLNVHPVDRAANGQFLSVSGVTP